ncbi:MAG: hypothetical protein AB8G86_12695 [Saprospiraceae bacterium]
MKRLNILYIFWLLLAVIALLLMNNFVNTSKTMVFGMADTEGQILNYDSPVVVDKIYVRSGSQVKAGDTLMLLKRPELEREKTLKSKQIQTNSAESAAVVQNINESIEKLRSQFLLKSGEIRSQIGVLTKEEKAQAALRKIVNGGDDNNSPTKSIIVEKIEALRQLHLVEQQRYNSQLKELKQGQLAQSSIYLSKTTTVEQEIDFLNQAKDKLVLLAPIDGFIESIFVFENQISPQYNQLLKINPQKPNQVKGFLPESLDITYRLGDTVEVYAVRRPEIKSKAILIGSTPQLTQLPSRLKKFQTISTWGRELYISLPVENDFFIGEKVIIKLRDD